MTSPAASIDTPNGRIYINPLRQPSPEYFSVTRALSGGIPKPALEGWFKRTTAEYAVDNKAIWEQLPRDTAVDLIRRESDRVRDAAADRGSIVHAVLEAAATVARPDTTWQPDLAGYVDAGLRFLDEWQPDIVWVEVTVFSDQHLYAGTFDLLAHLPGLGLAILDWKTSSDIYPETGLQLAAYRYADYVLIDNQEQPIPAVTAGAGIHLRADGTYSLVPLRCGPDEHATFLHALSVARFTTDGYKHVKSPPLPAPSPEAVADELATWLRARLEYLRDNHPGALDSLAAMWPAELPTLRQGGYTLEQLDEIRTIIKQVEAAFSVPFGRPDPLSEAAPQEVRDALRRRLEALPADLLDRAAAEAQTAGVPNIGAPLFSRAHAQRLEPIVAEVEREAGERTTALRSAAVEALGGDADVTAGLLAEVGVDGEVITWPQLEQFTALCRAVTGGVFQLQYDTDAGRWTVVCPGAEARLVKAHGSKSAALAVCREIAGRYGRPTPRSTAAAVGDPVLVAFAATHTDNTNTQGETAA